jgi:hypothetical protein
MKKIGSTRQMKENGRNLVDEVKEYCEDVVQCRRRMLLTHFDDETRLTPDTTRQERTVVTLPICCDNCNFPPRPLPAAGEDKDKGKAGKGKAGKAKGKEGKKRTADEATNSGVAASGGGWKRRKTSAPVFVGAQVGQRAGVPLANFRPWLL